MPSGETVIGRLNVPISKKVREWVVAAESEVGRPSDAVWACDQLKAELLRWSRWWLGCGAFVLAAAAALVIGPFAMSFFIDSPGGEIPVVAVIGVLALSAAVLAASVTVLWRLHRSGRRVARSDALVARQAG